MSWPIHKPDGSLGYHNMREIDIVFVKLDLIQDALKQAGIPIANYMKYTRSGEFVYDNPDKEKTVRPDPADSQNVARNRPTSSDVESA